MAPLPLHLPSKERYLHLPRDHRWPRNRRFYYLVDTRMARQVGRSVTNGLCRCWLLACVLFATVYVGYGATVVG